MSVRILIVAGTRPEVIKMAPIHLAMRQQPGWEPIFLSTGQHREMMDQACKVFGIQPDLDLNLMTAGQTLPDLTARVITSTTQAIRDTRPAAILLQGDTTTVLGTALAAFYERIPIGHVEAGLRTYNYEAPWPEEMNRRLTDPISRWCFAPTATSRENLLSERIPAANIHITGNTVIDALLWVSERLRQRNGSGEWIQQCGISPEFAARYLTGAGAGPESPLILVTGHRRESFGSGFEGICQGIREIVERHPNAGVLYPVHLNPQVREPVFRLLGNHPRIRLIEPVGYEPFVWLMNQSRIILSDSGGVQEEAPSLGKPTLVMRETTERPEGVAAGTCRLVGTDPARIATEIGVLLGDTSDYDRRSKLLNPYGDGKATERILQILKSSL